MKTTYILKFLNVLSWIIFLGLCIEAGGIIFNAFFTHFVNQIAANTFWKEIDFSGLYTFDWGYFFVIITLMSIVAIMKALMFYQIVKTLNYKNLNIVEPFSEDLRKAINNLAYIVLAIGLFSKMGIAYSRWLVEKNVVMPESEQMGFDGAAIWFFMSVIFFMIAFIFKRGIEIQNENELTI